MSGGCSPGSLAAVYIAHGASDRVHPVGDVSPANPRWLHEMCVPFDWLLGAWVLFRGPVWDTQEAAADAH